MWLLRQKMSFLTRLEIQSNNQAGFLDARQNLQRKDTRMTVKDWNDLQLPVAWCIYKESEPGPFASEQPKLEVGKSYQLSDLICEFCGAKGTLDCDCHDKLILDLDAPVPDGVYRVTSAGYNPIWESGITVKDGKFVPKPTADALYRLVVRWHNENPTFTEAIDHCFVESLEWNGKGFEVFMGS